MIVSVALLLGATSALAGTAALAVMPGLVGSEEDEIRAALARAGYPDAVLTPPDTFVGDMDIVSVTSLAEDDCGGPVEIDDWRGRLAEARVGFQMLDFSNALSALVLLEVELVCLSSPLAASDLLRLELAVAEAHTWLAQVSEGESATFHRTEADAALERAAVVGASLATPADVSPEVLEAWDEVRRQVADRARPRVVVAGPGARVGARFDGRPLPGDAFDAVAGVNVVQAATGSEVTAAASVRLRARSRTLLWLAPGGAPVGRSDVVRAIGELSDRDLDDEGRALLAAAAKLAAGEVVFVEQGTAGVRVWRVEGAGLVPAEGDGPRRATVPRVERWRVAVGLGANGGWSSVGGGELAGLGGANVGPALYGRVGLTDRITLAFAVHPSGGTAPIPEEAGGGTLFRATLPVRAGVRLTARDRGVRPEVGLDVGWHYFGVFDTPRMSLLVVGAGGVSGAVGPNTALRAEAFAGGGLGYAAIGAVAGIEWRF